MSYRLGVVCSGGGARGIAHIGVLHALEERGIHAECLAGTSAGAIVAALYSGGHSTEASRAQAPGDAGLVRKPRSNQKFWSSPRDRFRPG